MKRSARKERWDQFARNLVIHWNLGKAYLDAGFKCSPASARRSGLRLLSTNVYIQEKVGELVEEQKKVTQKAAEDVIRELETLGFSNIKDYLSFGPAGVTLKASSELTDEQMAAIAEVSQYETKLGKKHFRFKLYDKRAALQDLGKHHKLFTEKFEVGGEDGKPIEIVLFSKLKKNADSRS